MDKSVKKIDRFGKEGNLTLKGVPPGLCKLYGWADPVFPPGCRPDCSLPKLLPVLLGRTKRL